MNKTKSPNSTSTSKTPSTLPPVPWASGTNSSIVPPARVSTRG